MHNKLLITAFALLVCIFPAYAQEDAGEKNGAAVMIPTKESHVAGTVRFSQRNGRTTMSAELSGLIPGQHGFHVHEFGDCSAADFSSAGDHFNPTGKQHGAPGSAQHHVGDLGNLTTDDHGNVRLQDVETGLSIQGANSIIGRALVIHEKADDLKSQPSGNSGPRVACAVVGIAK